MIKISLITALLFIASTGTCLFGQQMSDSELLASSLKHMDLKFKRPRGFEQLILPHPTLLSTKNEAVLIGGLDYKLKPIGSNDYRIALGFYDSDTSRKE